MKARITRVRDVPLPEYKTAGAAAFDIAVAIDGVVPPGGELTLPTGLIIKIPDGHMLLIAPRSSTFKKTGLRLGNTIGIIDPDFCGPQDELGISFWNPSKEPIAIKAGDRIAQGVFVPIAHVEWEEGPAEGPTRGGWGSTGGYTSGKV